MSPSDRRRRGLVELGIGLAAAGVGAALGVAAERAALGRPVLGPLGVLGGPGGDDEEEYGSVRSPARVAVADDGTALHVEVDEPDPRHLPVDGSAPLTVVFCHGYCLSLDAWHFQRKALRGRYRLVCYDQRGHGRSATGPEGSATIDQLGRDLAAVVESVVPDGPLVLVGHSMGGMTIMAFAEQHPGVIAERVPGVAFVATSAGGLSDVDYGLPHLGRRIQRLAPAAVRVAARVPGLVAQGRRIGSDLEAVLVRRWSFGSSVTPELVRFCADMIMSTRLEVISDFMPAFSGHDKRTALAVLDGREVLVIVGDHDLMTPAAHSEEIVAALPGAEHVVVTDAGHLLMLEHPEVVTGHLVDLIERARRSSSSGGTHHRRLPGLRRTVTSLRRRRHGAA